MTVKVAHIRQGKNAFAFTCDKAGTFWGHFLIRTACLRLRLKPGSKALRDARLAGQTIGVVSESVKNNPDTAASKRAFQAGC